MRDYGPEEPLQGGWESTSNVFQMGKVVAVDEDARAITVRWKTGIDGATNVAMVSLPGDHSLPMIGDRALLVVDFAERYMSLGFIETTYKARVRDQIWPKVKAGEICFTERNSGSMLYMDKDKGLVFENVLGSGLRTDAQQEETTFTDRTIKLIADIGTMVYGIVKRQTFPLSGPEVITDSAGNALKEWFVEISNGLGRLVSFIMGNVVDSDGDTMKSSWGSDLRGLIQFCGDLGLQVGQIQMDKAGNIELNFEGTQKLVGQEIRLEAPKVVLGDNGPAVARVGDTVAVSGISLVETPNPGVPPVPSFVGHTHIISITGRITSGSLVTEAE